MQPQALHLFERQALVRLRNVKVRVEQGRRVERCRTATVVEKAVGILLSREHNPAPRGHLADLLAQPDAHGLCAHAGNGRWRRGEARERAAQGRRRRRGRRSADSGDDTAERRRAATAAPDAAPAAARAGGARGAAGRGRHRGAEKWREKGERKEGTRGRGRAKRELLLLDEFSERALERERFFFFFTLDFIFE